MKYDKIEELVGKQVQHSNPELGIGIITAISQSNGQKKHRVTIQFFKQTKTLELEYCLSQTPPLLSFLDNNKTLDDIKVHPEKSSNINYTTEGFLNELKVHGFDGFIHVTDFENFISIMKSGYILSRNEAAKSGFIDAASNEMISQTRDFVFDFVRFYYRPKTPTFFRNEGIKNTNKDWDWQAHMPIPVCLVFSESLIDNSNWHFSDGNCASGHTRICNRQSLYQAQKINWNTVFSTGPYDKSANLSSEITRIRQAEFLYPKKVSTEKLKAIYFRSPADLKHARVILGENDRFHVDNSKFFLNLNSSFSLEHNALYDYSIDVYPDAIDIYFRFFSDPTNYDHYLKIITKGSEEKESLRFPSKFQEYRYYRQTSTDKIIRIEYYLNNHLSAIWRKE